VEAARRAAVAGVIGLLLPVAAAFVPSMYLAYQSPAPRAALEAATAVIGVAAVLLALSRRARREDARDLLIVCGIGTAVLCHPLLGGVSRAVAGRGTTATWATVNASLLSAGLFAAATVVRRSPALARRAPWTVAVGVIVAGGTAVAVGWLAPTRLEPEITTALAERAHPSARPEIAIAYLVAAVVLGIAVVRLVHRSRAERDAFVGWVATGCAIAAAADIGYALFPWPDLTLLHIGDALRAAAAGAWLVGGIGEVTLWSGETRRDVRVDERQRLARRLHDGLAQDVALVASLAAAQSSSPPQPSANRQWLPGLRVSAERALAESRAVLVALDREAPPEAAGLPVPRRGQREEDDQEVLVQIVREAVTNAMRHGEAQHITVDVDPHGKWLRVHDDGSGFVVGGADRNRRGLCSMEELARALGGRLVLRSHPGEGTTIEVEWP
jgi:signal transduction histidine kinase